MQTGSSGKISCFIALAYPLLLVIAISLYALGTSHLIGWYTLLADVSTHEDVIYGAIEDEEFKTSIESNWIDEQQLRHATKRLAR